MTSLVTSSPGIPLFVEPPPPKPDASCLQNLARNGDTVPALENPSWERECERPVPGPYAACGVAALTPACSVASDVEPRDEKAEGLLRLFREQFAVHIPITFISAEDTPQELQAKRPWVYRTVLMLASQEERSKQIEQGVQITRDLTDALLIRGQRNLDLLQALLIYSSW